MMPLKEHMVWQELKSKFKLSEDDARELNMAIAAYSIEGHAKELSSLYRRNKKLFAGIKKEFGKDHLGINRIYRGLIVLTERSKYYNIFKNIKMGAYIDIYSSKHKLQSFSLDHKVAHLFSGGTSALGTISKLGVIIELRLTPDIINNNLVYYYDFCKDIYMYKRYHHEQEVTLYIDKPLECKIINKIEQFEKGL